MLSTTTSVKRSPAEQQFGALPFPRLRKAGQLSDDFLFTEADKLARTASNAELSLRLASVLLRAEQDLPARRLLDRVFKQEQTRLDAIESPFDWSSKRADMSVKFTRAFCEAGEIERAERVAELVKNGEFLHDTARFDCYLELARGQILHGNAQAGKELLMSMVEGKGATADLKGTGLGTEKYLPQITRAALELGEFGIAAAAALARNPEHDCFQRTAAVLRGAAGATLYAAGQDKNAKKMLAAAIEGPESDLRNWIVKHYELAARLTRGDATALKEVKTPEKNAMNTVTGFPQMVGKALVRYWHLQGEAGMDEMETAARDFSDSSFCGPAVAAFRNHLEAGRLILAQDFLLSEERKTLLHSQEKLWHEMFLAGQRAGLEAVIKVATLRIAENLESDRLMGAGGRLWSLHLAPLAALHLRLGNFEAAKSVCGEKFLHEATEGSSAAALGEACLDVLEERFPAAKPDFEVFPFCWFVPGAP